MNSRQTKLAVIHPEEHGTFVLELNPDGGRYDVSLIYNDRLVERAIFDNYYLAFQRWFVIYNEQERFKWREPKIKP